MLAVEHDPVGFESLRGELRERAARGAALRLGHADEIALLVRRVPDADRRAPRPRTRRGRDLAFVVRQQLRVAHAGEVLVAGHDRRDRHRAGPRAPPDLVDSDHDTVARRPALPLDSQRRIRRDHERVTLLAACARGSCCRTSGRAGHAPYDEARETRHARRGPEPLRVEVDARIRGRRPRRRRARRPASRCTRCAAAPTARSCPVTFAEADLREENRRSTWWI